MNPNFWEETALNSLLYQTDNLSKEYVQYFNGSSLHPDFQKFLNEISPNLIAIKMQLQDRLRALKQEQPAH